MEEDIKILENINKLVKIEFKHNITDRELQAIQNLINRNKELERLHISDNKHLDYLMQNSIPTSVIKEKIEELKKYKKSLLEEYYLKKQKQFTNQNVLVCNAIRDIATKGKIDVLQELLEKEK